MQKETNINWERLWKNVLYVLIAFVILSFAVDVFAYTVNSYTRTPSGSTITETNINFVVDVTPTASTGGYRYKIVGDLGTTYGTCHTRTPSTADIEFNEDIILVIDSYTSVGLENHEDNDCSSLLEVVPLETTFEIVAPPTQEEILQGISDNLESFLLIFLFFFLMFGFIKMWKS